MVTSDDYREFLVKVRDKTEMVLKGIANINAMKADWAKEFALRWHGDEMAQCRAVDASWFDIRPSANGTAMTATLKAVLGQSAPAGMTNCICDVLAQLYMLQQLLAAARSFKEWPKHHESQSNGIISMGESYTVVIGGNAICIPFDAEIAEEMWVYTNPLFQALGLPPVSGMHGEEDAISPLEEGEEVVYATGMGDIGHISLYSDDDVIAATRSGNVDDTCGEA